MRYELKGFPPSCWVVMNEAPSVSHELEEEQESLRLEAEALLNEAQPASTARAVNCDSPGAGV